MGVSFHCIRCLKTGAYDLQVEIAGKGEKVKSEVKSDETDKSNNKNEPSDSTDTNPDDDLNVQYPDPIHVRKVIDWNRIPNIAIQVANDKTI